MAIAIPDDCCMNFFVKFKALDIFKFSKKGVDMNRSRLLIIGVASLMGGFKSEVQHPWIQ